MISDPNSKNPIRIRFWILDYSITGSKSSNSDFSDRIQIGSSSLIGLLRRACACRASCGWTLLLKLSAFPHSSLTVFLSHRFSAPIFMYINSKNTATTLRIYEQLHLHLRFLHNFLLRIYEDKCGWSGQNCCFKWVDLSSKWLVY